ncbi:hypothetical protein LXL04_024330 [Taraxacum kok-saghyz]
MSSASSSFSPRSDKLDYQHPCLCNLPSRVKTAKTPHNYGKKFRVCLNSLVSKIVGVCTKPHKPQNRPHRTTPHRIMRFQTFAVWFESSRTPQYNFWEWLDDGAVDNAISGKISTEADNEISHWKMKLI